MYQQSQPILSWHGIGFWTVSSNYLPVNSGYKIGPHEYYIWFWSTISWYQLGLTFLLVPLSVFPTPHPRILLFSVNRDNVTPACLTNPKMSYSLFSVTPKSLSPSWTPILRSRLYNQYLTLSYALPMHHVGNRVILSETEFLSRKFIKLSYDIPGSSKTQRSQTAQNIACALESWGYFGDNCIFVLGKSKHRLGAFLDTGMDIP